MRCTVTRHEIIRIRGLCVTSWSVSSVSVTVFKVDPTILNAWFRPHTPHDLTSSTRPLGGLSVDKPLSKQIGDVPRHTRSGDEIKHSVRKTNNRTCCAPKWTLQAQARKCRFCIVGTQNQHLNADDNGTYLHSKQNITVYYFIYASWWLQMHWHTWTTYQRYHSLKILECEIQGHSSEHKRLSS